MGDSRKVYGFAYAFAGWRSTFRVFANSEAEAKKRAAAMAAHEFVGELKPVDPSCVLSQSDDSAEEGWTRANRESSASAARPTTVAARRS